MFARRQKCSLDGYGYISPLDRTPRVTGSSEPGWHGAAPRGTPGLVMLALLLAIFGNGCTLIKKAVETPVEGMRSLWPGGEPKTKIDPVALQENLLRYADNLTFAYMGASLKLQRDGQPVPRKELLTFWVAETSSVLQTATGSNALANLVGMIVLTTTGRMRVEEFWLPKRYGESARPMLKAFQDREKQIWRLAETLMTPSQRQELRNAIEEWRPETKQPVTVPSAFVNIALSDKIIQSGRREAGPGTTSVFSLLDIDPLAELDPATRELAQTRLLAERAMYIGQRMPQIFEWQVELLSIRTAELPQFEQVVSNTARFAAAGDRVGKLAEELPGLVSSERKEIFRGLDREQEQFFKAIRLEREKFLAALQEREPGLTHLSREIGVTFGEGARMAASTETALKAFDGVMARFEKEPSKPKPEREPFRIKDYADTAEEIGRMSERLTTLVNTLQSNLAPESVARLSTEADLIAEKTQARGKEVVDYAFHRVLLLVAAVFAAALAYRALVARLLRSG